MTIPEFEDFEEQEEGYCSWCDEEYSSGEEHECFVSEEWDSIELVSDKFPIKKMKEDYYD